MKNKDKPAFAVPPIKADDRTDNYIYLEQSKGLTKLEYASIIAMQGLLASCTNSVIDKKVMDNLPQCAIDLAAELLKQLDNEK